MIKIYGIKNCDTIKKTLKWFDAKSTDYQFIDYKKERPSPLLAKQLITTHGWETIVNKRGTTWRKLDDQTKDAMSNESAIKLIQEQPSIIKRPIVESNEMTIVGFDEEQFEQLI